MGDVKSAAPNITNHTAVPRKDNTYRGTVDYLANQKQEEVMRKPTISGYGITLFTIIGVVLLTAVAWTARQTNAVALNENTSDTGLITVNAGQTARLIVSAPNVASTWGNDRPVTLVFGFDVFKPSVSQAATVGSVQKHFLLERRVNEVSLGRSEAASFDFASETGLLHVRPLVFGDGSVRKVEVTVELINSDGTVATASLLPAIQRTVATQR
jgi:hypothetical protein